jgi:hypothetical protein
VGAGSGSRGARPRSIATSSSGGSETGSTRETFSAVAAPRYQVPVSDASITNRVPSEMRIPLGLPKKSSTSRCTEAGAAAATNICTLPFLPRASR